MVVRELFARMGLEVDRTSFSKVDAMLGGLKSTLVGLGVTLTAGAVYHGLKNLVENTAAAARGAGRAAQRIGLTREAYEELSFAAEHSGLSAEQMEVALKFLNRAIYEGGKRGGETAQVFRQLGVGIGGGARAADQVLEDLAERFKGMQDGPQKTAMAMRLFGRSGIEMIPMLNKGKEGIAELREEAHKLGMVFSGDDVKAAKAFKEASLTLHATLQALQRTIAVPLMRQLAESKKRLTEWLRANREIIRERLVWFVTKLVGVFEALSRVMLSVVGAAQGVGGWLSDLAEKSGALKAAFWVLGGAIAVALWPGIAAVGALFMALEEVWGWVTGSRNTLLEDWFGPWKGIEDFFKVKMGDSGPVQAIRTMAEFAADTLRSLYSILELLGLARKQGPPKTEEEKRLTVYDSVNPKSLLGMHMAPITRWLYGKTGWDTSFKNIAQTLLPLASRLSDPAVAQLSGFDREQRLLSVGAVNVSVTPPPGADPKAFGSAVADGIAERFEELWDMKMSAAHPAATR